MKTATKSEKGPAGPEGRPSVLGPDSLPQGVEVPQLLSFFLNIRSLCYHLSFFLKNSVIPGHTCPSSETVFGFLFSFFFLASFFFFCAVFSMDSLLALWKPGSHSVLFTR